MCRMFCSCLRNLKTVFLVCAGLVSLFIGMAFGLVSGNGKKALKVAVCFVLSLVSGSLCVMSALMLSENNKYEI